MVTLRSISLKRQQTASVSSVGKFTNPSILPGSGYRFSGFLTDLLQHVSVYATGETEGFGTGAIKEHTRIDLPFPASLQLLGFYVHLYGILSPSLPYTLIIPSLSLPSLFLSISFSLTPTSISLFPSQSDPFLSLFSPRPSPSLSISPLSVVVLSAHWASLRGVRVRSRFRPQGPCCL